MTIVCQRPNYSTKGQERSMTHIKISIKSRSQLISQLQSECPNVCINIASSRNSLRTIGLKSPEIYNPGVAKYTSKVKLHSTTSGILLPKPQIKNNKVHNLCNPWCKPTNSFKLKTGKKSHYHCTCKSVLPIMTLPNNSQVKWSF